MFAKWQPGAVEMRLHPLLAGLMPPEPPAARVVVVHLATGEHDCYDLRPGSQLHLTIAGDGRFESVTGKRALRARVGQLERALEDAASELRARVRALGEAETRLQRAQGVLAAVASARTLEEAKARVLWSESVDEAPWL